VKDVVKKPEIFIALIAPIGVNLDSVQDELCSSLQKVSYKPHLIKLTSFLTDHKEWFDLTYQSEFQRYEKFIAAGNSFCKQSGRRDAFALSAIAQIYRDMKNRPDEISDSTAFIFRQIKRVEEIKTLKQVYGRNIIFLGCYSGDNILVWTKSLCYIIGHEDRQHHRHRLLPH
jgi:hypothetical protein